MDFCASPAQTAASRQMGRIRLESRLLAGGGADWLIGLTGGEAHLGGLAVASGRNADFVNLPGHRDGEAALALARAVAAGGGLRVAVCAGIHYPAITAREIADVFRLIDRLAGDMGSQIARLQRIRGKTMLNISQVDEFIAMLRSGRLEEDFKKAGEIGRGEILELLERVMDAGELADEVATRLIFRGLPSPGGK